MSCTRWGSQQWVFMDIVFQHQWQSTKRPLPPSCPNPVRTSSSQRGQLGWRRGCEHLKALLIWASITHCVFILAVWESRNGCLRSPGVSLGDVSPNTCLQPPQVTSPEGNPWVFSAERVWGPCSEDRTLFTSSSVYCLLQRNRKGSSHLSSFRLLSIPFLPDRGHLWRLALFTRLLESSFIIAAPLKKTPELDVCYWVLSLFWP